jgi:hypothetical protein
VERPSKVLHTNENIGRVKTYKNVYGRIEKNGECLITTCPIMVEMSVDEKDDYDDHIKENVCTIAITKLHNSRS